MAVDPEYIRTVLDVQYRWRIINITRLKSQTKPKQKMISDSREHKY